MGCLSISDWIAIISGGLSLILAIVIAVVQYKQSKQMAAFEKRQDERDERRHDEGVKAQAVAFISKYYPDRGLVPLCAVAAMHNDLFYYSREMYREFCCLTLEVQNRILEYCKLDLRVVQTERPFCRCIDAVEKVLRDNFPQDESPFYEGGKYVLRSLERYSGEKIPVERIEYRPDCMDSSIGKVFSSGFDGTAMYESCITDVLSNAFQKHDSSERPVAELEKAYGFRGVEEIEACQFATTLAQYVAIYWDDNTGSDKNYGSPGAYDGETIETMEDLFLLSVFEMYTRLVLKEV